MIQFHKILVKIKIKCNFAKSVLAPPHHSVIGHFQGVVFFWKGDVCGLWRRPLLLCVCVRCVSRADIWVCYRVISFLLFLKQKNDRKFPVSHAQLHYEFQVDRNLIGYKSLFRFFEVSHLFLICCCHWVARRVEDAVLSVCAHWCTQVLPSLGQCIFSEKRHVIVKFILSIILIFPSRKNFSLFQSVETKTKMSASVEYYRC